MEKYKILFGVIESKKRLTQKEVEKNNFEQYDDTTIFETNNKEKALKQIEHLLKITSHGYDCYNKNYTYKRFELVQEVYEDETEDPDYTTYESLAFYYPTFEEDEEDE